MKQHYFEYLSTVASRQWNDLALSDYNEPQQYTFGEMAATILRLHQLFRLLGIKEGDKIALCGRNCANWAVAYLAIMSYRAVVVSILQDFKAEDVAHLLTHSDSRLLFVGPYVWKELQAQPLKDLEAVISLPDWSCLRAKDENLIPDAEQLEAAFRKVYPRGITADDFHFDLNPDELCLIKPRNGLSGLVMIHQNDILSSRTQEVESRESSYDLVLFVQYGIASETALEDRLANVVEIVGGMETYDAFCCADAAYRH